MGDSIEGLQLSIEDINSCESIIQSEAGNYNANLDSAGPSMFGIADLPNYKRTYVGKAITDLGEIVFIQFNCGQWHEDHETEMIFVMDGGSCYFEMKINLTTRKAFDFYVNGVA